MSHTQHDKTWQNAKKLLNCGVPDRPWSGLNDIPATRSVRLSESSKVDRTHACRKVFGFEFFATGDPVFGSRAEIRCHFTSNYSGARRRRNNTWKGWCPCVRMGLRPWSKVVLLSMAHMAQEERRFDQGFDSTPSFII